MTSHKFPLSLSPSVSISHRSLMRSCGCCTDRRETTFRSTPACLSFSTLSHLSRSLLPFPFLALSLSLSHTHTVSLHLTFLSCAAADAAQIEERPLPLYNRLSLFLISLISLSFNPPPPLSRTLSLLHTHTVSLHLTFLLYAVTDAAQIEKRPLSGCSQTTGGIHQPCALRPKP